MRENKECENWGKCSSIAARNKIAFSCDTCDGTAIAENAGRTVNKPLSETKICKGPICKKINPDGVRLPISEFGRNRTKSDGLQLVCKKCVCESVRVAKINRKNRTIEDSVRVATPDLLYKKLIEKLNYHKTEVEKIKRVLETIEEITGKEAPA